MLESTKLPRCIVWSAIVSLFMVSTALAQNPSFKSSLFRVINCQVLNPDGTPMPVVAYKNMKNPDEVILINLKADHALIVNLHEQKAFKVSKPLLGTNAVNVSDYRPEQSGNVGFQGRKVPGKKDVVEIIVYFKNGTCFLCGSQTFASIWE